MTSANRTELFNLLVQLVQVNNTSHVKFLQMNRFIETWDMGQHGFIVHFELNQDFLVGQVGIVNVFLRLEIGKEFFETAALIVDVTNEAFSDCMTFNENFVHLLQHVLLATFDIKQNSVTLQGA